MNKNVFWGVVTTVVMLTMLIAACMPTPGVMESATTQPPSSSNENPTPEPTVDPVMLAEAAVNDEIAGMMQLFDDGEGLVSSYDIDSMPGEDFDRLTEEQKSALTAEKMIDQANAVLSYVRIGKMKEARRVLQAMQDMLKGDMADYVRRAGGPRSIGWWHVAAQQYYLLIPDPNLIEFMQWCDYKGFWRQPVLYSDAYVKRITGEREDFWELETNIESLIQTVFYLKLDQRYGLDTIYAVNNPEYNVDEQRVQIAERFNGLADNLKQVLYYGDETGLHLIEEYTLLDTYTNAVIMSSLLEKEFPEQFKMADVNIDGVLERIESNYAVFLDEKYHLYKAANEPEILPSFEASLQVANAYLAAAEIYDYRNAHPEHVQGYVDQGLVYVVANDDRAAEYRAKAETIVTDILEFTSSAGDPSIPQLEKNNTLYTRYGPYGFRAPAMSSLAQYVQFKKGTFFKPLEEVIFQSEPSDPIEVSIQTETPAPACVETKDSLDAKYRNYNAYTDWNDPDFMAIRQDLEARGLHYLVEIISENGIVSYNLLLMQDDPRLRP